MLGKQLNLFTISQRRRQGLILWMPKGATVRGLLEDFIKDELLKRGYQPVYTPHIGRLELYRTSGHFPYYRDAQFPPMFGHPAGSAGRSSGSSRLQDGQPAPTKTEKDFLAGRRSTSDAGLGDYPVSGQRRGPSSTALLQVGAASRRATCSSR